MWLQHWVLLYEGYAQEDPSDKHIRLAASVLKFISRWIFCSV